MRFNQFQPSPFLTDFIHSYWTMESDQPEILAEIVYPTGEPQILFHLAEPFCETDGRGRQSTQPVCLISGQLLEYNHVTTTGLTGMLGINFHPYGLRSLLNVPMQELNGAVTDLADFLPGLRELGERLPEIANWPDRIALAEKYLLNSIRNPETDALRPVRQAIRLFNQGGPTNSVSLINREIGVSDRQQERFFRDIIGLTPARFAKIVRLEKAMQLLKTDLSLTKIALTAGYFDQAHFNHDFLHFVGLTPGQCRQVCGQN